VAWGGGCLLQVDLCAATMTGVAVLLLMWPLLAIDGWLRSSGAVTHLSFP
jgi:hypothetical protein